MMKNAFTLVELIAVVVILGIILVIAIPRITDVIDNARESVYQSNEKMIVNAAIIYLAINQSNLPINMGDILVISLEDLQRENLITPIIDPKNGNEECNGRVMVTKSSELNYDYHPYLDCGENYQTTTSFITDNNILYNITHSYNSGTNDYTITIYMDETSNGKELITPTSTIGLIKPTLIDYTGWALNTTGSQGLYGRNGLEWENEIILKENPWGQTDVVWATLQNDVDSNADGGWNHAAFNIDHTKLYRYTLWIRRENVISITAGNTYVGLHGYPNGVENWNGTRNTNPYSHIYGNSVWRGSSYNFPQDEWLLFVSYVYPSDAETTNYNSLAGVYDINGNQLRVGQTSYRWADDNTTGRPRTYLYYSTQVDERHYWYRPRFEIVDGKEPPIQELLNGLENPNIYDYDTINKNGIINYNLDETGIYNFIIVRNDNSNLNFSYTIQ